VNETASKNLTFTQPGVPSGEQMITGKRMAVVINGSAGFCLAESPYAQQQRLAEYFVEAGLKAEIYWVEPPKLLSVIEDLKESGVDIIVVGGGDGTINGAANALVGTDVALGVLPLGTFNHFARDLGMPLPLEEAIRALAKGTVQSIDVGEVNGRVFVNNASIGIYTYAVRRRDIYRQQLGLGKLAAMGYALLGALWRLPVMRIWLQINGRREFMKTPFIFVGNNRYEAEPFAFLRRQSLSEGLLSVFYTRKMRRWTLFKIVFQTLLGRMQKAPELEKFWTEEVRIEINRKRLKLVMDGEVVPVQPPLMFHIRRRVLRVVTPAKRELR